ncbi:MAG TPA: ERCC4 domain-containing protein [Myxococcota bacterium]|jgi:hypothetical protein|nr:ERCC4 domain-containing protein [Myxococcota bacterium]
MPARWRVERTQSPRFPFRISIEQDGRVLFAVRAQSDWPAPGGQIFCLREREHDPGEALDLVDSVPIASLHRVGVKLAVVLDRPRRKRCEFLSLVRERKDGSGSYEQVFFRTETAIRAHRSRGRVELVRREVLDIAIDLRERYPWRFPGARVTRRELAVGDYALLRDDAVVAVAERKSLENLLGDIGAIRALHQSMAELARQPRAAVVIEAQYGDVLDPARTRAWPPNHVARVVAELAALHPRLPFVFAGNRKLANVWTERWFGAVAADLAAGQPLFVSDVVARYESAEPQAGGLDERIRRAALSELASPFRAGELRALVPEAEPQRVARVLQGLRREGRMRMDGARGGARWSRVSGDDAG